VAWIRLDAAGEERCAKDGVKNVARHARAHRKASATAAIVFSLGWSTRDDTSRVNPDIDVVHLAWRTLRVVSHAKAVWNRTSPRPNRETSSPT